MSCSRKRRNKTQLGTASKVIRRTCCGDGGGGGGSPCYCFAYMCVACCPDGELDIVFMARIDPLCDGRIRPIVWWGVNDKCYVVYNGPDDPIFWDIHDPFCCDTNYGDNENCLGFDIPEGCDPLPEGVMPLPDDAVFLSGNCVANCDDALCECEEPEPDPTCCNGFFKPCTRALLGGSVSWNVKFFGTYTETFLCGTNIENMSMDSETHSFNHSFTITDSPSACSANATHSEAHNFMLKTCDDPVPWASTLHGAATSRLNSGSITRAPSGYTTGSTGIGNPAHGITVSNGFGVVTIIKSLISGVWGAHVYTEGYRTNFLQDVCHGSPYTPIFSGSITPFGVGVRCGKLLGGVFNVTSSVVPDNNDFCELPVQTSVFKATMLAIETNLVDC